MELTINIPEFALSTRNNDIKELKQTIKLSTVLMLYKNSKFSIEQASNFTILSIYNFMEECKNNKIPIIDYKYGELESEIKLMNGLDFSSFKVDNFKDIDGLNYQKKIRDENKFFISNQINKRSMQCKQ